MKSTNPFVKLPPRFQIGLVVVLALLGAFGWLCRYFFHAHWGDSTILAAYPAFGAAFFSLIASVLLLFVTISYVIANYQLAHDNHELAHITSEQFKKSQTIFAEFGLSVRGMDNDSYRKPMVKPEAWVANLGVANFLVTQVEVVVSDGHAGDNPAIPVPANRIATVGDLARIELNKIEFNPLFSTDIQIKLCLRFLNETHWTEPRGFNITVGPDGLVVRNGYHKERLYTCPQCREFQDYVALDGVQTELDLQAREAAFLKDMARACFINRFGLTTVTYV